MKLNTFVCLTCGFEVSLPPDHPGNARAHDGVVFRGSCEKCHKEHQTPTHKRKISAVKS